MSPTAMSRDPVTAGAPRIEASPPAARVLPPAVLAVALVVLAFNLRPTIVSLPPLLPEVQRDLGLSGPVAGALTALPVLCMALFAPLAHRVAHRFGREGAALAGIALIAAGNGLRLAGQFAPALFLATFVAGLGIAACGVVLAGIVKEFFPRREGAASAAYIVAMMLGAATAPTVAVPLESVLGSWQASLAAWALPAAVAAGLWLAVTMRLNTRARREVASRPPADPHRCRMARHGIPDRPVDARVRLPRVAGPVVPRARLER